jgi:hypothetical protein
MPSKIGGKVIHPPNSGLCLKEEWGVVRLVLLQLLAHVGNDTVIIGLVGLGEYGPHTSGVLGVPKTGVSDKVVGVILAGVIHDWFRAKV